ncbi:unnamed protein product, partial [Discosporangium mesarthrocarpum]
GASAGAGVVGGAGVGLGARMGCEERRGSSSGGATLTPTLAPRGRQVAEGSLVSPLREVGTIPGLLRITLGQGLRERAAARVAKMLAGLDMERGHRLSKAGNTHSGGRGGQVQGQDAVARTGPSPGGG